MNLIHQKEALQCLEAAQMLKCKDTFKVVYDSPVFMVRFREMHREFEPAERRWIIDHLYDFASGLPRMVPFPVFRIADSEGFDQWVFDEKLSIGMCLTLTKNFKRGAVVTSYAKGQTVKYDVMMDGQPLPRHKLDLLTDDTTKEIVRMPHLRLILFLFDVMSPANTVIKVSPAPQQVPRSVEWVKAREHYLILHRNVARDMQLLRTPSDKLTREQLTRAAHARRAHFRLLVSDKWRNKKGQTVPVRKAWIGPKEWEGTDKKIYKVVDIEPKQHESSQGK